MTNARLTCCLLLVGCSTSTDAGLETINAVRSPASAVLEIAVQDCKGREIPDDLFGANNQLQNSYGMDYDFDASWGQLGPVSVRWPGGEESDAFDWETNYHQTKPIFEDLVRDTLGLSETEFDDITVEEVLESDAAPRILEYNYAWFLDQMKQRGSSTSIVINLEGAYLDHAEQGGRLEDHLYRYADSAAELVRLIARNHNSAVQYWEIGNESYFNGRFALSARQYADAFRIFATRMKAQDSSILIGAIGPKDWNDRGYVDKSSSPKGPKWWPHITSAVPELIDFASFHYYDQTFTRVMKKPGTDEAYPCSTSTDCPGTVDRSCPIDGVRQSCHRSNDVCMEFAFDGEIGVGNDRTPVVSVIQELDQELAAALGRDVELRATEWNVSNKMFSAYSRMEHLIYVTEVLGNLIEGGVDHLQYWPGLSNIFNALFGVHSETKEILRRPVFHLWQYWLEHVHARHMRLENSDPGHAYAFGSCAEGLNRASLFVTNKEREPRTVRVAGLIPGDYELTQLTAWDGPYWYDKDDGGDGYCPQNDNFETITLEVAQTSEFVEFVLPAKSLVVLSNVSGGAQLGEIADKPGVYRASDGSFTLEVNGDRGWERGGEDAWLGGFSTMAGDKPLSGRWSSREYDDVGVYRPSERRFLLDLNGDGVWNPAQDASYVFGASGDIPITGDWNCDGLDEIGVFRPKNNSFSLDRNGDGRWTSGTDRHISKFGRKNDIPIAGDWNQDGCDEIGVYRPKGNSFTLDRNNTGSFEPFPEDRWVGGFAQSGDLPVVGDWNGDGRDQVGIFRPSQSLFILDRNNSFVVDYTAGDYFQAMGKPTDLPLSGRWR
ncbi:MAG: hypothetical protein AAFU77_03075 [Myxococcota bacterium]